MITLSLRLINDSPCVVAREPALVEICPLQPDPGRPLICSYLRWLILEHEKAVLR